MPNENEPKTARIFRSLSDADHSRLGRAEVVLNLAALNCIARYRALLPLVERGAERGVDAGLPLRT